MRDGTETVVRLGNTGVLEKRKKNKKNKRKNLISRSVEADCIHRVPAAHQTVVVRSSVRGELSSLPAACICRSEKMPVGDRG